MWPEFLALEATSQRSILGELLYPRVVSKCEGEELAPKITGMLRDYDSREILNLLESEQRLEQSVQESLRLLTQPQQERENQGQTG